VTEDNTFGLSPLELARVITLNEAAKLNGVSTDTVYREYRDLIVRVSAKRVGMRMRDALMLPKIAEQRRAARVAAE
jgi:hypothetical protein